MIAWRATLRVVALTAALVFYGSLPRTSLVQTEVESQLSELLAETIVCDVRSRLKHGASSGASADHSSAHAGHGRAERRMAEARMGERLSFGTALPLRC